MRRILVFLVLGVVLTGCVTQVPPEKIAAAKSLAIISAVEPDFVGQEVGITSFGNEWWMSDQVGVDINAVILDTIKSHTNRDVKLVHGRDVKLRPERKFEKLYELTDYLKSDEVAQANRAALAKLGREWGVDMILVIQGGRVGDWMRRSMVSVYGVGQFARNGSLVYAVLQVKAFDCATGELQQATIVRHALEVEVAEWFGTWAEYSDADKRAVRRALPVVLRETVPYVLVRCGLASQPVGEPPLRMSFFGSEMPPSITPEGNVFEIPSWASPDQAREAALFAFKEREWTVTKEADGVLIGTHPNGQKLAVCTVRIGDGKISLTPECFEIKADGSRVAVEYLKRWHENLKESLYGYLLQLPDPSEKSTAASVR